MSDGSPSIANGRENTITEPRDEGDEYTVRSYRDDDRERFLSLYETVWGHARSPAWFGWRFEQNPYSHDVRMVVAEKDGELVGAEPLLPFRVVVDGTERPACQPVDWIVHPDHRRRGLFTRMTESLLETETGEAAFLFNFPTDSLRAGLQKFDWDVVGTLPCYYRLQDISPVLDALSATEFVRPLTAALSWVADPAIRRYLGVRDHFAETGSNPSIERRTTIPTAELVDVYSTAPPDRIHVARDEAFYSWRFENPQWETTTYLIYRDGSPVASLVVATEAIDDTQHAYLVDAQPMCDRPGLTAAFDALLGAAVADHEEASVMAAAGSVLPPAILRRWGFLRDDQFPLSILAEPTTLVVRSLPPGDDVIRRSGGHDLTDPNDWLLSLAGQDIE